MKLRLIHPEPRSVQPVDGACRLVVDADESEHTRHGICKEQRQLP